MTTDYTPSADFSADEASSVSGRSTVNTAALDAELAAVSTSINEANDAIADVRRSDGELKDAIVKPHTLHSDTLAALAAAFNPRGDWATATDYAVRDVVEQLGGGYLCVTAHTSGTFSSDDGAGYWLKLWDETFVCAASAPADADVPTGRGIFYLDEAGHNLKVRVRYSDGTTLKTGTLAIV